MSGEPAASGAVGADDLPTGGGPVDLGSPTTLLLVRHGRTEDTDRARARGGDSDGPALTDAGVREVRLLAEYWTERSPRTGFGSAPVALITSPVARARQTAAILAQALALVPEPDPGWAELALGEWDGLGYAQISAGWPHLFRQWQGAASVAPPGGESLDDVARRVAAARDRLVTRFSGRTVLVVSHTAPIRTVLSRALDAGPAALWRLRVDPTGLSTVRFWADGGCEVAGVNFVGHLW